MSGSTPAPPPLRGPATTHPTNNSTISAAPVLNFTSNAPASHPSPPFIRVEGVPNFRELGGYACTPAPSDSTSAASSPTKPLSVRRNYLFRCATLAQITPVGVSTLTSALSIQTLYDLRSQPELNSALKTSGPKGLEVDGITRHFTPVYHNEDYSPVALVKQYAMYTAPDEDPGHGYSAGFVRAYRDIAQHAGPAYRKILEHVRDRPDEPLIFHCTAGKDRTGVLAALILRLCGVDDDVIAWEYGITEHGLGDWRRVIVERLMAESSGGYTEGEEKKKKKGMSREQAERIVGSRAKNMMVFLQKVLDGEFGGVRQYLGDYCGFTDADLDKIKANLLVEAEPVGLPEGWRGEVRAMGLGG
jgi:hypothetical protein